MGVFGRAALLPSKEQYISTYAGLPIEQTEKFLADANKRFYENIGTTGKIGAAIAQLDLLEKDNPLREEWKTKIDEHIKGVADDEGAWENAGFNTAMMATNFASDDSVQLGLRNKTAYGEYTKGLEDRLARGNITQTQLDYYKQNPLTLYGGAGSNEQISKHFGSPAQAVDIQDKIAQFEQIKKADFYSGGWEWNGEKGYYEKESGEVMRPEEIKRELKEWLLADPLTRDFVQEMEMLDPSYMGQLQKTIDGSAQAMGYSKVSHDIRFAPNYGKGKSKGTKSSNAFQTAGIPQLVTDPETQVTSPADFYLTQAYGDDKLEVLEKANLKNLETFEGRVENHQDSDGNNNYYTGSSPDNNHFVIIDKNTDMPVPVDQLPIELREARASYLAQNDNIIKNKDVITERKLQDNQMYKVAESAANQRYRTATKSEENPKGIEPPSQEQIQISLGDYEHAMNIQHTAEAIQDAQRDDFINRGMRPRDITVTPTHVIEASLAAGDETYSSELSQEAQEEVDQLVRMDIDNSEKTVAWLSENKSDAEGAYFNIIDSEIRDKFEGATERVQIAHVFVNPQAKQVQEIATVAKAMVGSGVNSAKYVQTHAVEWYGSAVQEGKTAEEFKMTAEQLQDVHANGQMDIESWVFDKRDGKMKAIFRVTAKEGGVLGFFQDENERRMAVELPPDFEQRLMADVAYREMSNPMFSGATATVRSMIKAKLFQSYKETLDVGYKLRQGTDSGGVRDLTGTSTFQTSIGNLSVQYTPGVSDGPVPRLPKYVISAYDKNTKRNRTFQYDNEVDATSAVVMFLQQAGAHQAEIDAAEAAALEAKQSN